MIVTLEEAKTHLRVTHDLEDDAITLNIEAAEEWIMNFTNRDSVPVKSSVKAAALLIVACLYENREAYSEKSLHENEAITRLLWPYRIELGI